MTAEQHIRSYGDYEDLLDTFKGLTDVEIIDMLVSFAQYHVEQALKKVESTTHTEYCLGVDTSKIYPLNKIQ